jgi:hypothetical protein
MSMTMYQLKSWVELIGERNKQRNKERAKAMKKGR